MVAVTVLQFFMRQSVLKANKTISRNEHKKRLIQRCVQVKKKRSLETRYKYALFYYYFDVRIKTFFEI